MSLIFLATALRSWNMTIASNDSSIMLFFDDNVNVITCNPAALILQSAATRSSSTFLILSDVSSSSCTALNTSSLLVRLTGTTQQRLLCHFNLAINPSNTFLSMGSNFIRNSMDEPVDPVPSTAAKQVAQFSLALLSPSIVQANRLVLNSGYLDFTLNVPVRSEDIDVTHLRLVSGMRSYTITSTEQRFTITNCFRIGLTLSSFDLDRIMDTLLTEGYNFSLETTPGAFVGIDGQTNIAQNGTSLTVLNDTISPGVTRTSLDFSSRVLILQFLEPVSFHSFNGSKISIVNQLQSPSISYDLFSASVSRPAENHTDILSITLTTEFVTMIESQPFIGDTRDNTLLSLQDGFVQDFANNSYSSVNGVDVILLDEFITDQIMPQLTSATMDLDNGYLQLTFNEPVRLNTFNTYEIYFYSTTCSGNVRVGNYSLQSGSVHSQGVTNIVHVQVSHDLDEIVTLIPNGQSQTCLHLTALTAMDYANRPLRPVFFNINLIPDVVPPSVVTFYKNSESTLIMVFSEVVDVQSFNVTSLLFVFTNISSGLMYNVSDPDGTPQSQNSNNVLITLSEEFLEIEVTNDTTVDDLYNSDDISIHLLASDGLVNDLSDNPLVGSGDLINQCVDNCTLMGPLLTGFDLDMNNGRLILSFSHAVSLQQINGNVTITNRNSNPDAVYTFMNLSMPASSLQLTHIINIGASDVFSLQSIPRLATLPSNTYLQVQPVAATDGAGLPLNNTTPIRVSSFVPDVTRPVMTAFDLDLDAGLMSLFFSEPVKLSTFNITSVGLVNMVNGDPLYLVNATALSDGIQMMVDYFLDQNILIDIKRQELCYSMTNCYSVLSRDATEDAVGNNVVQITTSMPLRIRRLVFDATPPYLLAFTQFDLDAGTFTLLFNEPVNSSSADVTTVQFGDAYLTPMHTISLDNAFTTPDHTEITFTLTMNDLNEIKNNSYICTEASNCWIRLPRFFISDIHSNPFYIPGSVASYHQPLRFVGDSTPSVLISFIADANRGELLLLFNEVMILQSLNPSDVTIMNGQAGTIQLQLSEASGIRSNNLTSLVIELTRADLNILKSTDNIFTGMSNTFLLLATTTQFSDASGNLISAGAAVQAVNFIPDSTPPELTSFVEFNMNNGSFVLSFSEPINENRIYLARLTLQGLQNGGPSFTLTGGKISNVSMYNTVIEILLTHSDREIVKVTSGLADNADSTFIYFSENAFYDLTGNGIVAKPSRTALHLQGEGYIEDSSQVSLVRFELDMNQEIISLAFDDAVDINSISYPSLVIQNQSALTDNAYQLTSGFIRNNSLGGINSNIALTRRDVNAIKGLLTLATTRGNTYITITSQFIRDYEGRDIIPIPASAPLQTAAYHVDTTFPELEAFASLDMDIGTLELVFSETILVSDTMVTNILFQHRQNSSSYSYRLQDSSITTDAIASVDIAIQLSYGDWNTIKSIPFLAKSSDYTMVRLDLAAVTDTSANQLQRIPVDEALLVTSFVPDTTKPRLIAFDITLPDSTITLYFSEAINLTTLDTGGLYIINEVASSPSISQPLQSINEMNARLQNLTTIVITLTPDILNVLQNPNINIGHSASITYISALSSTIQDFYGNTLVEIRTTEALRVRYLSKYSHRSLYIKMCIKYVIEIHF